jgi:Flp pilus assembly protein TadB
VTVLPLVVGALWALLAAHTATGLPATKRLPPARDVTSGGPVPRPRRARRSAGRASGVRWLPRPLGRRVDPSASHGALGYALLAGLPLLVLQPELAPVPLAAVMAFSRLEDRRRAREHERAIVDQLPDLVDLLRLTTLAGLPVGTAICAIGARPGGVVGDAVAHAARLLDRGAITANALDALAAIWGAPARSLVEALADHDRYGTPLSAALDRVGIECRLRRRRMAEEAARRLPVTLLFPLVLTTLPAFALLTILPILVGSFSSLQL